MATRATTHGLPDTYFQLVRKFPLIHIRDDEHLNDALAMIGKLLEEERDTGAQEYLDALTDLVEIYEDEHVLIPDASSADVLRALMGTRGISQIALAKEVGMAQSTISAVLNGSRKLTSDHIITLARFFHVAPAAFLPTL